MQPAIGRFTDAAPESLIFSASGTPLRASNFRRRVWYPAVAQIDEEGLRIHDVRHTCASMLIAAGAHPGHVREHLGHSSIRSQWMSADTSTKTPTYRALSAPWTRPCSERSTI